MIFNSPQHSTALLHAIRNQDNDQLAHLIECKADANASKEELERVATALALRPLFSKALKKRDAQALSELIKEGADVNLVTCFQGNPPPLFVAARNDDIPTMTLLIESGADPDGEQVGTCPYSPENRTGESFHPLYAAIQSGHLDAVDLLLQNHSSFQKCPAGFSPNGAITERLITHVAVEEPSHSLLPILRFFSFSLES